MEESSSSSESGHEQEDLGKIVFQKKLEKYGQFCKVTDVFYDAKHKIKSYKIECRNKPDDDKKKCPPHIFHKSSTGPYRIHLVTE